MGTSLLLSVVIPIFNERDNVTSLVEEIHTALVGVCDFEVIFIDDGSEDNTVNSIKNGIKKLSLKNIPSRIYTSTHKGPGNARNIGIKNSKYEYIAFIDSDDIWYDKKLDIDLDKCIDSKDIEGMMKKRQKY